jgi:hypothetical protein
LNLELTETGCGDILVHVKYLCGAVAQLGERVHGMHEVRGSIPLSSTIHPKINHPQFNQVKITVSSTIHPKINHPQFNQVKITGLV